MIHKTSYPPVSAQCFCKTRVKQNAHSRYSRNTQGVLSIPSQDLQFSDRKHKTDVLKSLVNWNISQQSNIFTYLIENYRNFNHSSSSMQCSVTFCENFHSYGKCAESEPTLLTETTPTDLKITLKYSNSYCNGKCAKSGRALFT